MKTKAAVLYQTNTPFVIEELELQEPQQGEVLVELKATGICRTDEHALDGGMINPLPAVLGHEGAGIVRQVGPGVTSVQVDDHVISVWMPSCGKCEPCRKGRGHLCVRGAGLFNGTMFDGTTRLKTKSGQPVHSYLYLNGFSQYMVIHEDAAIVVNKDAAFDRICLLGCAATTGFGAATLKAQVEAGSTAVFYGFGGIGAGVLNGLKQSGALKIILVEPQAWKEETARKMGVTHFINPTKEDPVAKILEITNGVGADYAFDCWGTPEVQAQCYNSIRNQGKAIYIGAPRMELNSLPVNCFSFCVTERIIQGCLYGSAQPKVDVPKFVEMYMGGKFELDSVVTRTFKLEEINEAFRAMHDGEVIRGVIKFD